MSNSSQGLVPGEGIGAWVGDSVTDRSITRQNGGVRGIALSHGDMEGAAGHHLVPPLDDEDVVSILLDGVGDVVHPVSHVFDVHFLTGRLGPVHTHHQHVCPCRTQTTTKGLGVCARVLLMYVWVRVRERDCVGVCERERECKCVCVCVCVCVRERERVKVCVCVSVCV